MDDQLPSYRSEFFRSKHHVWLSLTTLGLGFLLGADQPLFLLIGAAAYALGWIYLPDLPFFRRSVDERREKVKQAEAARSMEEFQKKRDALHAALTARSRNRYAELAEVCRQIEQATAEDALATTGSPDPRLGRLDELMWTFLRLLNLEDGLERFLELERREDVPRLVREAEAEIGALGHEIEGQKKSGASVVTLDAKERLLQSRLEALDVLRKRQTRIEETEANLALVRSEQERLDHQIKLIRADAVASQNSSSISARIDATVENLNQTNKWLAEINEFKDAVGQLPPTEGRVGYAPTAPPVLADGKGGRPAVRQR
jgi:hypothetical protein